MSDLLSICEERRHTVVQVDIDSLVSMEELDSLAASLYRLTDERGIHWLVLDFTKVENITSQSIGVIASTHRKVKSLGGQMVLCGINARLTKILSLTRLDKVLVIRLTQADASDYIETLISDE